MSLRPQNYKLLAFAIAGIAGFVLIFPQTAFGYSATFEVWGKPIQYIPTVCTIEPDHSDNKYLSEKRVAMMMEETKNAVNEWEVRLKHHDSKSNWSNWEIEYNEIPREEQDEYNYDSCDVFIQFKEKPEKEHWYQKIGETQYEAGDTGRSNIIIYYAAIDICMTEDAKFYYYDPCYSPKDPRTLRQIGSVVRHEFGHALGLGHYLAEDLQLNVAWARGSSPAPSIMIKFTHQNTRENRIQPEDIQKVHEVYGNFGFKQFLNDLDKEPTFESFDIDKPYHKILRGGYGFAKIYGKINDEYFREGVSLKITILNPDGSKDIRKTIPSRDRIFETQFITMKGLQEGTYYVKAEYRDKISEEISFGVFSESSMEKVETDLSLIKENTTKWVNGEIDDSQFIEQVKQAVGKSEKREYDEIRPIKIPQWFQTSANLWTENKVSDIEFTSTIKLLLNQET